MRQRKKKTFLPTVESIEQRIAASSGLHGPAQALMEKADSAARARKRAPHKLKDNATAHQARNQAGHKAKDQASHKAKDQSDIKRRAHPKVRHPRGHKPRDHVKRPVVVGPPIAPPIVKPVPTYPVVPPTFASPEAWVKLVNMTGQDLRYQISLGPYQDGKFLAFDIAGNGPDSVQYRFASLVVDGRQVEPSFAIKFQNGPIVALNTGPSAQSARGYYIFFDSNFQPQVSPFIDSKAT